MGEVLFRMIPDNYNVINYLVDFSLLSGYLDGLPETAKISDLRLNH